MKIKNIRFKNLWIEINKNKYEVLNQKNRILEIQLHIKYYNISLNLINKENFNKNK